MLEGSWRSLKIERLFVGIVTATKGITKWFISQGFPVCSGLLVPQITRDACIMLQEEEATISANSL